jgi:hypothetical protein
LEEEIRKAHSFHCVIQTHLVHVLAFEEIGLVEHHSVWQRELGPTRTYKVIHILLCVSTGNGSTKQIHNKAK